MVEVFTLVVVILADGGVASYTRNFPTEQQCQMAQALTQDAIPRALGGDRRGDDLRQVGTRPEQEAEGVMAYDEFCTRTASAYEAAAAQAAYNEHYHRHYNRGTMRPENNDPDAGVKSHGDAVEMIYDDLVGAWVEQRQLPAK